jgi:cytidylate kinase
MKKHELSAAPVITIDGAGATGKGTISRMLAVKLNWHLLESGALYRLLALAAERHRVALDNEEALEVLAAHLDTQFVTQPDHTSRVILEGEEVTESLRAEEIGNAASIVAVLPAVRQALLSRQRVFRKSPGLVAEGRDMGTIVFPDAELKIYLETSLPERAKRRLNQLKERGIHANLPALMEELHERDRRDQERLASPLKPALDAVWIITDGLSAEEVIAHIVVEIERKKVLSVTSTPWNEYVPAEVTEV